MDVPSGAVLPKGDGKATCAATTTLAYAGAQTGPNAQLGINIFNGIQLAINQHNAANPGCQVQFKKFDTEGDPNKATGPVTQLVSESDIDYGIGLGTSTSAGLGSALVGTEKVTTGQKDFSAVISKIMNAKADAVFYSGYYAEGAPFDQQLSGKGFTGTFVAPDGVKDDQFIKQAGDASNNAYFTCPCIPGELIPDFASAYKELSKGAEPGTYSIEGYDAATVLLSGIDAGKQSRPDLLSWVKAYDKDGLSKHLKWDAKGELQAPTVYGYKVENGKIVPIGPIGD